MTETFFAELCDHLSGQVWLQALLVTAGTCFLEDVARCGVSLLVATGHLGWWLAFLSMTAGGMAGDVGLYLIRRYATKLLYRWRWVDPLRLEWMEAYFKSHAVKTIFISRFLPGARTVTNTAAGAVRYPLPSFLVWLLVAAVVQALLFLQLGVLIGERILPYLEDPRLRMAVLGVTVLILVLAYRAFVCRRQRKPFPPPCPSGDVPIKEP